MKYFIISDIHANYSALKSVLQYADDNLKDYKLVCLGDIVGYGPSPEQCLDEIFGRTDMIILGNHDSAIINKTETKYFSKFAKESIKWTEKRISRNYKSRLKKLKYKIEIEKILFVHSTPCSPESWAYILSIYDAYDQFVNIENQLVFIGHTHIPLVYEKKGDNVKINFEDKIHIEQDKKYIVNVGSVGQPRDGDNRASAVIYDTEKRDIDFVRLQYNVFEVQKKILDFELPPVLARRLGEGL